MSTLSNDLETASYEAALYFYPLVIMDVTRLQSLNSPPGQKIGFGPPNRFHHVPAFPTAEFRGVVRPNFDTLYSTAWLDLTGGPVVLHLPDTDDRYYTMALLDMWTDVFAAPGKRTTGTSARDFVITAPGYRGELPAGASAIDAPTPHVWVIGRTQTNGPADYPAVHEVQEGYRLTSLGADVPHTIDPDHDTHTEPLRLVNAMKPLDFFVYAGNLLAANPPHATDFSQLARLAAMGIVAGMPFRPDAFTEQQQAAIESGWRGALTSMMRGLGGLGTASNGWAVPKDTIGVYGNAYHRRAVLAMVGLGANPPEDAVYPFLVADADGKALTGENDYVVHFAADALPPVSAFWSITMYDAEGFQVANDLGRFAIGDRDDLTFAPDGSLDIYIQHASPGADRESNWLPAPRGPLSITMRLYAPDHTVLDGTWNPPPVRRV